MAGWSGATSEWLVGLWRLVGPAQASGGRSVGLWRSVGSAPTLSGQLVCGVWLVWRKLWCLLGLWWSVGPAPPLGGQLVCGGRLVRQALGGQLVFGGRLVRRKLWVVGWSGATSGVSVGPWGVGWLIC